MLLFFHSLFVVLSLITSVYLFVFLLRVFIKLSPVWLILIEIFTFTLIFTSLLINTHKDPEIIIDPNCPGIYEDYEQDYNPFIDV